MAEYYQVKEATLAISLWCQQKGWIRGWKLLGYFCPDTSILWKITEKVSKKSSRRSSLATHQPFFCKKYKWKRCVAQIICTHIYIYFRNLIFLVEFHKLTFLDLRMGSFLFPKTFFFGRFGDGGRHLPTRKDPLMVGTHRDLPADS